MTLETILETLAIDFNLDADLLKSYAAEDKIGGYEDDKGNDSEWPIGSIHPLEGKIIYSLMRALQPEVVVEFGVAAGCSSKHILKALVKNRKGKLISYDPVTNIERSRFTAAEMKRWQFNPVRGEELDFEGGADIVFEDTDHTITSTQSLVTLARALKPRVILVHDAAHYFVGKDVLTGIRLAGLEDVKQFKPEGSSCGYAYWINDAE